MNNNSWLFNLLIMSNMLLFAAEDTTSRVALESLTQMVQARDWDQLLIPVTELTLRKLEHHHLETIWRSCVYYKLGIKDATALQADPIMAAHFNELQELLNNSLGETRQIGGEYLKATMQVKPIKVLEEQESKKQHELADPIRKTTFELLKKAHEMDKCQSIIAVRTALLDAKGKEKEYLQEQADKIAAVCAKIVQVEKEEWTREIVDYIEDGGPIYGFVRKNKAEEQA